MTHEMIRKEYWSQSIDLYLFYFYWTISTTKIHTNNKQQFEISYEPNSCFNIERHKLDFRAENGKSPGKIRYFPHRFPIIYWHTGCQKKLDTTLPIYRHKFQMISWYIFTTLHSCTYYFSGEFYLMKIDWVKVIL